MDSSWPDIWPELLCCRPAPCQPPGPLLPRNHVSKGQCLKSSAAVTIPAWSFLSLLHAHCLGNARDFATDPWSNRQTLDSFCSKFPALRLLSVTPAPRAGSYPAIALSYRSNTPCHCPTTKTHTRTDPASLVQPRSLSSGPFRGETPRKTCCYSSLQTRETPRPGQQPLPVSEAPCRRSASSRPVTPVRQQSVSQR